jgi:hypothetical protein
MSDQTPPADPELEAVAAAIQVLDPEGLRTARVLRDTIDQLYDGQRTGRYRWIDLFKTEKTHCGTLVEINLQREFRFADGGILDFSISGLEVDCKYSQDLGKWMIPPEATGQLCLVLSAKDDAEPHWSMGLVRTSNDHLSTAVNRDGKRSLNAQGRAAVHWLFHNRPLPANVLLQIDPLAVNRMMALKSGAGRVRELFRIAQKRIVGRAVVATAGQQKDYMKRVRANGGARTTLRPEGLLVLGQYSSHVRIAAELGLLLPGPGDSISARVARAAARCPGVAEIDGGIWRLATENDPVEMAPILPKPTRREVREEDEY